MKNITKYIAFISILPSLFSAIKSLVEDFESSSNATGEQKKAAVLEVLRLAIQTGESFLAFDLPEDTIIDLAGSLIDIYVKFKNTIGEFTHKTTTTTATA